MFKKLTGLFKRDEPPKSVISDSIGTIDIKVKKITKARGKKIQDTFKWLDDLRDRLKGKYEISWTGSQFVYYLVNEVHVNERDENREWGSLNLLGVDSDTLEGMGINQDVSISVCLEREEDLDFENDEDNWTVDVCFEIEAYVTEGDDQSNVLYEFSFEQDDTNSLAHAKKQVEKIIKDLSKLGQEIRSRTS
jgi:hypothetical protein